MTKSRWQKYHSQIMLLIVCKVPNKLTTWRVCKQLLLVYFWTVSHIVSGSCGTVTCLPINIQYICFLECQGRSLRATLMLAIAGGDRQAYSQVMLGQILEETVATNCKYIS